MLGWSHGGVLVQKTFLMQSARGWYMLIMAFLYEGVYYVRMMQGMTVLRFYYTEYQVAPSLGMTLLRFYCT